MRTRESFRGQHTLSDCKTKLSLSTLFSNKAACLYVRVLISESYIANKKSESRMIEDESIEYRKE